MAICGNALSYHECAAKCLCKEEVEADLGAEPVVRTAPVFDQEARSA